MKHVKLFETWLFENLQISEVGNGERVVFMPGRFQPFHLGHIAALKKAHQLFKVPVIPIQIVSDKEESPFPEELLLRIGKEVVKNENFIKDFFIYPKGYGKTVIPWFVRFLRDHGYEAVGVAAGSDRIPKYASQIKYILSDKTDTQVVDGFDMREVDARVAGGPSGTKVREAILQDDKSSFEKQMPRYLWGFYTDLKKHML